MKKHGIVYNIFYWLFGAILSFAIIWLIAGGRLADFLTSKGIACFESGDSDTAGKYFKGAKIFRPKSVINNYYLNKVYKGREVPLTFEQVRSLLYSKNEGIIIKGLEMAKEFKMIGLRNEVEALAVKGSDIVSDIADEVLRVFASIATSFRCTACGARYTAGMPEGDLPFVCARCGNRALYPEDRFTLAKLFCNSCGNSFIVESIPGRTLQGKCPKCGSDDAKQMYQCRSCGHTWGGSGFVTTCPKCNSTQVGSVSVTSDEARRFWSGN